jgi:hypothetical protein
MKEEADPVQAGLLVPLGVAPAQVGLVPILT